MTQQRPSVASKTPQRGPTLRATARRCSSAAAGQPNLQAAAAADPTGTPLSLAVSRGCRRAGEELPLTWWLFHNSPN